MMPTAPGYYWVTYNGGTTIVFVRWSDIQEGQLVAFMFGTPGEQPLSQFINYQGPIQGVKK